MAELIWGQAIGLGGCNLTCQMDEAQQIICPLPYGKPWQADGGGAGPSHAVYSALWVHHCSEWVKKWDVKHLTCAMESLPTP